MATIRYFHALNASQPVQAGDRRILFESYELTSTWMGVYATDDPSISEALAALAQSGTSHVTEIDQAEYEKCLKKKRAGLEFSIHLQDSSQKSEQIVHAHPVGAPVNSEPGAGPVIGAALPDTQSALVIAYVGKPESK
jgi:hypothetical protein